VIKRIIELDDELDKVEEDPFRVEQEPPPDFDSEKTFQNYVDLPEPAKLGASLSEVILSRRSRRFFDLSSSVSLRELATVLHLSVGVTTVVDGVYWRRGYPFRASPSAGGLNCVDVYVVAYRVDGLVEGIYYYDFRRHRLGVVCAPCFPYSILETIAQGEVRRAPVLLAFVGVFKRGAWKYGVRYYKYCLVDVGAAAENAHLAATAMGLASVMLAGFDKSVVASALGLSDGEIPLLLLAMGKLVHVSEH